MVADIAVNGTSVWPVALDSHNGEAVVLNQMLGYGSSSAIELRSAVTASDLGYVAERSWESKSLEKTHCNNSYEELGEKLVRHRYLPPITYQHDTALAECVEEVAEGAALYLGQLLSSGLDDV